MQAEVIPQAKHELPRLRQPLPLHLLCAAIGRDRESRGMQPEQDEMASMGREGRETEAEAVTWR
jgi:hypothetical protein